MNVPWNMPNINFQMSANDVHSIFVANAHLDQDQFMQQHLPAHVRHRHAGHDDQRADHEALRPGLDRQSRRIGGLFDVHHHFRNGFSDE